MLPARLRRARLIAIAAKYHYLRIYTDAGSDLVLMRMIDACALLPDMGGTGASQLVGGARRLRGANPAERKGPTEAEGRP